MSISVVTLSLQIFISQIFSTKKSTEGWTATTVSVSDQKWHCTEKPTEISCRTSGATFLRS